MKTQIQQLAIASMLTACLSLTPTAQIQIGGKQQAPHQIPSETDLSVALPADGNTIAGLIEIHKSHLKRALTMTEVRRALSLSATVPDGQSQTPFGEQLDKIVGRVLSLRIRETPEAFYVDYTIDRLPMDVRITFRAKFDSTLVQPCGGSAGIEPTTFSRVDGISSRWNGTRTFASSSRITPLAGSYNFALWRTCLR